ncbi:efflux RND transporter periplasmic adaptor subunit [Gilvimarinus sp. SDUM040013]|uniref:Efflux RND transporter periplasmic adaptor subunit n=1 Tax=Gilvimarinus gilvus TaxID=3058038 RepID=A0ABU4RT30_9GAMM|nr:efflux RND transporter periplasmic adaptor subunit [Gilvimarinus sp. SDUM040013]MDO3387065.1 efflux RND transporter periplasmic adaptor subunit [Gilvimarinus sp. SDUM040013]MDX6848041.1 efflux RND transporter periplasmic adaptor subunit [Gilvimarinus sp. SDUM040013]
MQSPGFFRRNIRWLLPILILVGCIVLFMGMAGQKKEPPVKPPEEKSPLVETRTIELSPMQIRVKSQGLVQPKYSTDLIAQVGGEVIHLAPAFVRGGLVKQGDILAQIDPTNYEVALENARAGLASAEASLELETAQGEVARVEWEDVNDRPAPALGLRKPQLEQAKARVIAAKADLKLAQKNLERTKIKAPYDALITERMVSHGTFLNSGAKLGHVMGTAAAEIRLPVSSSELIYLPNNGVGGEVVLTQTAEGVISQWQAQVVRSEGVIDESTRMNYLVAEVLDPYNYLGESAQSKSLAFGSYVVAQLAGEHLPSAVEVSRSLVKDGKVALYVDGQLHFSDVEVARYAHGRSIITQGLSSGDEIITTALEFPVEGMSVTLKGEAATEAASDMGSTSTEQGES